MSKYTFDPDRCKLALTKLNDYLSGDPATLQEARDALSDLCLDVEALHCRAQERDHVLTAVHEATFDHYIDRDELLRMYDCYTDENGDLQTTKDMSL